MRKGQGVAAIGDIRISSGGYIQVKVSQGLHKQNWEFEHRIIWAQENGPIPTGAFIHHLNGIKTDNRPENLHLVMSNSEHHKIFHSESLKLIGHNVGVWNRGKPKSAEHRAKISAANRGKPKSPEHRAKLSAALLGKPRARR